MALSPGATGGEGVAGGTVNPRGALGLVNPMCSRPGLTSEQRRSCELTGSPEVEHPISHYQLDVNIDKDGPLFLPDVGGYVAEAFAWMANLVWQVLVFVLHIILTVFGWVYALNPFGDEGVLRQVGEGLERFYRGFTEEWLLAGFVVVGAVMLWRGLVQRRVSESIAGTAMTLALMLLALWVIHDPRGTIGRLAGFVESASLLVVSAPSSGSLSEPARSYSEVSGRVWRQVTEAPFAALNFSDAGWAMSRPDPGALAKSDELICLDPAHAQGGARLWKRLERYRAQQETDCDPSELVQPQTVVELYLRSSPNSLSRKALWDYYNDDGGAADKVAMQGNQGAFLRFPLVILVGIGMAGAVFLFGWLALRLFMQTAVGFVLLLVTPLALLFPVFGEAGRAATRTWGLTLLGAIVAKLVYSAFLGVVLFGTTVIYSFAGDIPGVMSFMLAAAFWWAVFLKREEAVGWMSVARSEGGSGGLGTVGAIYATQRLGQRAWEGLTGGAGHAGGRDRGLRSRGAGARAERDEAVGALASREVDERARELGDARYEAARETVRRQGERRERRAGLDRKAADARERARGLVARAEGGGAEADQLMSRAEQLRSQADLYERKSARLGEELAAGEDAAREASELVGTADAREAMEGSRWDRGQLEGFKERVRTDLDQPVESGAHAWRLGMDPERYEALEGGARARAHAKVGDALAQDKRRFGLIAAQPPGLPDRAASREAAAYYRRLRSEVGRSEAKRRLDRERYAARRGRASDRRRARGRV